MSEEDKALIPEVLEPGKPQPNRIDVGKALKLHLKGLGYSEIARQFGVSPQAVHERLQPFIVFNKNPEATNAYRDNEAELLDSVALELSSNLLKKASDSKASVNNLAYAKRQVFDMRRLLRGESTANVSQLTAIIQASEKLHKEQANKEIVPQDVVFEGKTEEDNKL